MEVQSLPCRKERIMNEQVKPMRYESETITRAAGICTPGMPTYLLTVAYMEENDTVDVWLVPVLAIGMRRQVLYSRVLQPQASRAGTHKEMLDEGFTCSGENEYYDLITPEGSALVEDTHCENTVSHIVVDTPMLPLKKGISKHFRCLMDVLITRCGLKDKVAKLCNTIPDVVLNHPYFVGREE